MYTHTRERVSAENEILKAPFRSRAITGAITIERSPIITFPSARIVFAEVASSAHEMRIAVARCAIIFSFKFDGELYDGPFRKTRCSATQFVTELTSSALAASFPR